MAMWGRLKSLGFVDDDVEPEERVIPPQTLARSHPALPSPASSTPLDASVTTMSTSSPVHDETSASASASVSANEAFGFWELRGDAQSASREKEDDTVRFTIADAHAHIETDAVPFSDAIAPKSSPTHTQSTEDVSELRTRVRELEEMVTAKERDLQRLRQHLQDVQREYEAQLDEMRTPASSASNSVVAEAEAAAEVRALQSALEAVQRDAEQELEIRTLHLRTENAALHAEVEALRARASDEAALRSELSALRSACATWESELRLTRDDVQRLTEERASLRAALEEARARMAGEGSNGSTTPMIDARVAARLLVSYVAAPTATTRRQVLDVCASLLPLTHADRVALGLEHDEANTASWLSSPLKWWPGRGARVTSSASAGGGDSAPAASQQQQNKSLGEAWVDFLLREVNRETEETQT